jgi:hypothetical protein
MPRQQVEFEFPDPDKEDNTQEIEVDIVEEDAPLRSRRCGRSGKHEVR